MVEMKYSRDLYPKPALLKAAYSFTDVAYVHLDADGDYYYVTLTPKEGCPAVDERSFMNEILAQTVRHEVYLETKGIRELMYARAMATTVLGAPETIPESEAERFSEEDIVKDWFENDHENT